MLRARSSQISPVLTPRLQVWVALGLVYVIWGSTYLAIKFVVATVPPMLGMSMRFLLAGTILYTWVRLRGGARPTRANWRAAAIVGILLLLCGNGVVAWSEQIVPSGLAALLVSTTPLWMAVIDWLRPGGTRPSLAVGVGLALGFIGVMLLIGPNLLSGGVALRATGPLAIISLLVIPLSSLAWASGSIYSRDAKMPASPALGTAMEMLAGGAAMLIVSMVTGEPAHLHVQSITSRSLLGFLYLVVFGSLVAYSAYTWLLRTTPLSLTSTYAYVNPVVAVFLGWAIGNESLTPLTLLGAAIIVSAVGVITTFRSSQSTSPQQRVLASTDAISPPTQSGDRDLAHNPDDRVAVGDD
ncbi:MAG: EamA family transporter [Ktedonobacterales bacterium]